MDLGDMAPIWFFVKWKEMAVDNSHQISKSNTKIIFCTVVEKTNEKNLKQNELNDWYCLEESPSFEIGSI